jgi:hypothetical protein
MSAAKKQSIALLMRKFINESKTNATKLFDSIYRAIEDKKEFTWGNKIDCEYQLSVIVTPNKKYLKEEIVKYGFDTLEEITDEYLLKSGFISLNKSVDNSWG